MVYQSFVLFKSGVDCRALGTPLCFAQWALLMITRRWTLYHCIVFAVYQTYSGSCKSGVDCTIPRHPVYYGQPAARAPALALLIWRDTGASWWRGGRLARHTSTLGSDDRERKLAIFDFEKLMLSTNIRTHPLNGLEWDGDFDKKVSTTFHIAN